MSETEMPERGDRCPFPRPFMEGFARCPAYQAVRFIPVDSMNRPLSEATTCCHLEAGSDPENRGRFYPRCGLGTHADRVRWLSRIGAARLEAVRALQRELDEFTAPFRHRLAEARSRRYEAGVNGRAARGGEAELAEFLSAVEAFVDERSERFEAAGVRAGTLLELIGDWWTAWLASARSPDSPAAVGSRPPAIRGRGDDAQIVYSDAELQILYVPERPGLTLSGTVDVANVGALGEALSAFTDGAPEFHVDLAGVDFCDLAGMRAIVRTARDLGGGRRVVVHALPPDLKQVLRLVGWGHERLPGLDVR